MSSSALATWLHSNLICIPYFEVRGLRFADGIVSISNNKAVLYSFVDSDDEYLGPIDFYVREVPIDYVDKQNGHIELNPTSAGIYMKKVLIGDSFHNVIDRISIQDVSGKVVDLVRDGSEYPNALIVDSGSA